MSHPLVPPRQLAVSLGALLIASAIASGEAMAEEPEAPPARRSSITLSNPLSSWQVQRASKPESWRSWQGLRQLLGGVEVSLGAGQAGVASRLRTEEGGGRLLVASGTASETNFSVGLFGGPAGTGWRLAPAGGWFTRQVSLGDFAEALPESQPEGALDVPGVCREAESGEEVSCQAPNRYELELQSYFLGALAGYELVVGSPRVHLFGGAYASVNALELRRTRVDLGTERIEGRRVRAFRSLGAQLTAGVKLLRFNLATRATLEYQRFGRFKFGEPLEFRGPVLYDEERQVHYRPRYTVEDTSLGVIGLKISLAYLF